MQSSPAGHGRRQHAVRWSSARQLDGMKQRSMARQHAACCVLIARWGACCTLMYGCAVLCADHTGDVRCALHKVLTHTTSEPSAHLRQDKACRWQNEVSKLSSLTMPAGARDEGGRSLQSWQLPACGPAQMQSDRCSRL